ncbi:MAG TPA: glycogen/starch synthase, partial [Kiritimatiellia bacterium]
MKIGYISSEVTPFASTGGLADVAGALPAVLARRGHAVWRAMPMYR